MKDFNQDELLAERDRHEAWLRAQPGVVGTGVGMDKGGTISSKVFTNSMPHGTRETISQRLGHVPLAFEEVGEIRKQDA